MENKYKKFYLLSLAILVLLSIYPIYMGISVLVQYFQNGFIPSESYPRYIIPYTPICISVIISAALLPVIHKLSNRFSVVIDSVLGVAVFFILELWFEKIKVVESGTNTTIAPNIIIEFNMGLRELPLESWQYSLCAATPEVLRSIGEPIYAENNPAFKLHFYLISILIILSIIGILYGFLKVLKENLYLKMKALTVQTLCVALFVGLCIFACFTAFYRNGTRYISPLSAFLTGLFFVVFGVTSGMYAASFLLGKNRQVSMLIPSIIAMLTTMAMYIGELVLMDGKLFVFGKGLFFEPLGSIPFSACDIIIVLIPGVITALLSGRLNANKQAC